MKKNVDLSKKNQNWLKIYQEVAPIWNNSKYISKYAIEKAVPGDFTFNQIVKKVEKLRSIMETDEEFMLLELKSLLVRDHESGEIILTTEEERLQLSEFEVDSSEIKNARGVIVTAAQFDARVQKNCWNALKRYAEFMGYLLVALPIKYGPVHVDEDGRLIGAFDSVLRGHIILEKTDLTSMLQLNPLRMRPTLNRFLTDAICSIGHEKSQIFGAPKMELEFRPQVGLRVGDKQPKAIMTTGSVTIPNYRVDNLGQQDRTGELAEAVHTYGAVIIEFSHRKSVFHFRQLVLGKSGTFFDINPTNGGAWKVTSEAVTHAPEAVQVLVAGDYHNGQTDPMVRKVRSRDENGIVKILKPDNIVLQDFCDASSINPHERKSGSADIPLMVLKSQRGWSSLKKEMEAGVRELIWLKEVSAGANIHVIPSNHSEFVNTYISDGKWIREVNNAEIGAELFLSWIREVKKSRNKREIVDFDPVMYYMKERINEERISGINFYGRKDALKFPSDSCKKKSVLIIHGDIGTKGGRTSSLTEFRKLNMRVFIGHSHTAGIWDVVWRVGTSTKLYQHYVKNPATAWTNTDGLIFENGQRMLINIVKGKWHGQG